MPENVKRPNLEKSVKAELSRYEFEDHATCIKVEHLSVDSCFDCNDRELPEDCLEDCTRGHFEGSGDVREPIIGGGSIERPADFSGTFDVINYDHETRQFTTTITANYCKR